jgi:phage terminase Nu1 subunit (DNA packaging protein)
LATIAEAAAHLFIDERTLKKHLDEGIVTRQPRGSYDLDVVREEYLRHLREVASGRSNESNSKRADAGTRKDEAIAERYELEVAQRRAELIPRGEVLAGMSASFARVRAKLLALPTRLAPVVLTMATATEVQEKLNDGINEALDQLAGTVIAGISEGEVEPARG